MDLFTGLLISVSINFFAIFQFFIFRTFIIKEYESIRNWFMRNRGYGFVILKEDDGVLVPYFKKIEKTIRHKNKESYIWKSNRSFRFNGLPACLYNKGEAMPINLNDSKTGLKLTDAKFLDNMYLNTKAGAEAEAMASHMINKVLLFISIGLTGLNTVLIALTVYYVTGGDVSQIVNATP